MSRPARNAYQRGGEYFERGDWENAIQCYLKAIRKDKRFSAAYCQLGTAYVRNNQPEKALREYRKALKNFSSKDPNFTLILLHEGNALYYLKRFKEAIKSYRMVLTQNNGSSWNSYYCTYSIGKCFDEMGNKDEARLQFEKALTMIPKYDSNRGEVLLIQSAMFVALERYEEVLQTYEELEEYIPDFDCPTLLNKGVALQHLCNHDEAIGIYELIIHRLAEEDDMQDIKLAAEVNKALVFLAQGSFDTAKELMDNISVNPEDEHAMSLYKKCLDAFNISVCRRCIRFLYIKNLYITVYSCILFLFRPKNRIIQACCVRFNLFRLRVWQRSNPFSSLSVFLFFWRLFVS